jgi:hypothetical protein
MGASSLLIIAECARIVVGRRKVRRASCSHSDASRGEKSTRRQRGWTEGEGEGEDEDEEQLTGNWHYAEMKCSSPANLSMGPSSQSSPLKLL